MSFQRHSHLLTIWWARLSFPHVWEPQPIMKRGKPSGPPRYSTLIVQDPKIHAEQIAKIRNIERNLIEKSWGSNPPGKVLSCLKKGEDMRPGDANLKGKLVMSANAKTDSPPQVYQRMPDGRNVLAADRALIYSGCEAHVNVGLFTDDFSDLQVCVGLNIVIPTGRSMPRFDNRPTIESVFDDDMPEPPPGEDYDEYSSGGTEPWDDAKEEETEDWMK